MAEQRRCSCSCVELFACLFFCVLLPAGIAGIIYLIVISAISKDAVFSVTITGVAGLDLAAPSSSSSSPAPAAANNGPTLSPVFNLTVRIDNSRNRMTSLACVDRLSTVAVSYGDALLAGTGSVPEFCARNGKARERAATAWGQGVVLPPFLRDRLAGELAAGEAAVVVKVTTPAEGLVGGDDVLVCSDVRIGGGPALCREETVYH